MAFGTWVQLKHSFGGEQFRLAYSDRTAVVPSYVGGGVLWNHSSTVGKSPDSQVVPAANSGDGLLVRTTLRKKRELC